MPLADVSFDGPEYMFLVPLSGATFTANLLDLTFQEPQLMRIYNGIDMVNIPNLM